jgi:hypothetical protein
MFSQKKKWQGARAGVLEERVCSQLNCILIADAYHHLCSSSLVSLYIEF